MIKYEVWFGYKERKTENRTFNDYMNTFFHKSPKCMIQCIDLSLYTDIANDPQCLYEFKIGNWVLTSGDCQSVEGVKIYPPFYDLETAMDFSKDKLDINYFLEPPQKELDLNQNH